VTFKLAEELQAAGIDAIIDDRDERPGVKFKDADLVGFPLRVVIGEKSLASGQIELKRRDQTDPVFEKVENACKAIINIINSEREKTGTLQTV